ncbi:MAG: hypothetical protein JWR15_2442 [Prosthecobacter sp.]|nr:hypothetical protein [Prosthecobacter sp.]
MKLLVLIVRLAALCAVCSRHGGAAEALADEAPHVRILFLGNSYSAHNHLPAMVGEVMLSSKILAPHIASYLRGSYKLEQHAADKEALEMLKKGDDDGKPWDVLVVQEQSVLSAIAAVHPEAKQAMNSGLTKLVAAARAVNPQMLIIDFQVWARHENLWKEKTPEALASGDTPAQAHARIRLANANAAAAAREKNPGAQILVSPVGDFWWLVHDLYPALSLYAEDGTHPDLLGTLLSAYVIAGSIGGREVVEKSTWMPADCPTVQVERVRKMILDHPEMFKAAGK